MNIYGYLFRMAGFEVNKLEIISLLKDWSSTKAKREREYPQTQVFKKEYPLWTMEACEIYINKRLSYFESYRDTTDSDLPECTAEERWQEPTKYAVMKEGRKTAIKLYLNNDEAEQRAKEETDKTGKKHYIEVRESEPRRCNDYCPVKDFCSQYKSMV